MTDAERADRLAEWLRGVLRERELSRPKVAERAGLSRQTIDAIARGRHSRGYPYLPSPPTLQKVAVGLATRQQRDGTLEVDQALASQYFDEAMRAVGYLAEDDPAALRALDALLDEFPDLTPYLDLRRSGRPLTLQSVASLRELLEEIRAWRDQRRAASSA